MSQKAFPSALVQVGVIFTGGVAGWWLYRKTVTRGAAAGRADWRHHLVAGAILAAFAIAAFGLLQWWKTPPWLVVIVAVAAAAGQWVLGVKTTETPAPVAEA